MTKKDLLDLLEKVAKEYHAESVESVMRNKHMNDLTLKDRKQIRTNRPLFERFADAAIIDFINKVAAEQGLDLGLYTKHLK